MAKIKIAPEEIKQAVRDHYGKVAQSAPCSDGCCNTGNSACCSDEESSLYTREELAAIPKAAAASSRGCGNPVALASLKEGETVLDLGSGGGIDVLLAAKRVGRKGFVYGLDMTEEMLSLADRSAERAGLSNVKFLKGDIERIPLPDRSVDVIISNCVINLAPDKAQVLHEAYRVLRPGGRLAISDIVIDKDLEGFPLDEEQIRTALSWCGCIAGALTVQEYQELLEQAGFDQIAIDVKHRYALEDVTNLVPKDWMKIISPNVVKELINRFTSSSITARRASLNTDR
jgi:ubiquinone/menaquinone biosynthesis C-methylase UbiE